MDFTMEVYVTNQEHIGFTLELLLMKSGNIPYQYKWIDGITA